VLWLHWRKTIWKSEITIVANMSINSLVEEEETGAGTIKLFTLVFNVGTFKEKSTLV
jgi:hypothetical protein